MSKDNTVYIATSIVYANDVPHIGFAYELIQGDTIRRYHELQGKDVFFSTGTDEHGGKISEKAESLGVSVERFVEQNATAYKDLAPIIDVEYTKFIRTSDEEHKKSVQAIWKKLEKYIYKSSYVGLYDTREESFVTEEESRIIMHQDPERYDRLERLEEENYFFKLSEFTTPIKQAIIDDKLKIVPTTRKNEILSLLKEGLEDLSISRPTEKIGWGVRVPGDDKQTIYVWVDALLNYITTLGYPDGADFKKYWPADVHVIGKDILRFHAAIWPAFLLALGEELPKTVYAHGFITVDNAKMSKSVGNVVSPLELVSAYGSDATRYYLLRHIPSYSDGDFSWEKMERAYNGELGNGLGNLVQRVASMIEKYKDGRLGELEETSHDTSSYHDALEGYRFDKALDYCWSLIQSLNQYVDEEKPWALHKEGDEHLDEVLSYLASSIIQVAELISPFMPSAAEKIDKMFSAEIIKPGEESLFPRVNNYT